ncbi:hypothetical protein [Vibrio mediterranei]|uniref:hypothetical protein n=1 Tax=Vibrio mediterranei TaxID=689 RepID=UPI0040696621
MKIINEEVLIGRVKAILTREFGELPTEGVIAGGAVASAIFEANNLCIQTRYKDLDVFVPHTSEEDLGFITTKMTPEFSLCDHSSSFIEANFMPIPKGVYSILSCKETGKLNQINIRVDEQSKEAPMLAQTVVNGFDLNCTQAALYHNGFSFCLYYTNEFKEFVETLVIKPVNLFTGGHTLIRMLEKSEYLGVPFCENGKRDLLDSIELSYRCACDAENIRDDGERFMSGWLMAKDYVRRTMAMNAKYDLGLSIHEVSIRRKDKSFNLSQLRYKKASRRVEQLLEISKTVSNYNRQWFNGLLTILSSMQPSHQLAPFSTREMARLLVARIIESNTLCNMLHTNAAEQLFDKFHSPYFVKYILDRSACFDTFARSAELLTQATKDDPFVRSWLSHDYQSLLSNQRSLSTILFSSNLMYPMNVDFFSKALKQSLQQLFHPDPVIEAASLESDLFEVGTATEAFEFAMKKEQYSPCAEIGDNTLIRCTKSGVETLVRLNRALKRHKPYQAMELYSSLPLSLSDEERALIDIVEMALTQSSLDVDVDMEGVVVSSNPPMLFDQNIPF